MTARQDHVLELERSSIVELAPRAPTAGRPADSDWPAWLVESLRYRFWDPAEFARAMGRIGPFPPEQRAALAHWWSLLLAVQALGPPLYASMFARATEQQHDDQVRWSLLALLRDELQHEQVCRIALRQLAPATPGREAWSDAARDADRHLRQVQREAGRCWRAWRGALDDHGTGVLSGAMLLRSLVIGGLFEQWSYSCPIPAVATALRHVARDAERHRCTLRALTDQDCRSLDGAQRAEAAGQIRATARLLSAALLDPVAGRPQTEPGDLADRHACEPGFGAPTAKQRLELVRSALLELRDLHDRHGIDFQAMPELAIPAQEGPR